MRWVDSIATAARRSAAYDAYREGRSNAWSRLSTPANAEVSPHWLGLCGALSSDYLQRGVLLPGPALWAELSPFLLIPEEDRAAGLLLEYVAFKARADSADVELLGLEINRALHRLELRDARMTGFVEEAMSVHRPDWLALLSYETFRWTERALAAARRARSAAARDVLATAAVRSSRKLTVR